MEQIASGETRQKPPAFTVPDKYLPSCADPKPRTWLARDNVSNFIKFKLTKLDEFGHVVTG